MYDRKSEIRASLVASVINASLELGNIETDHFIALAKSACKDENEGCFTFAEKQDILKSKKLTDEIISILE